MMPADENQDEVGQQHHVFDLGEQPPSFSPLVGFDSSRSAAQNSSNQEVVEICDKPKEPPVVISLASEPNSGAAVPNNNRASEPVEVEMIAPPVTSAPIVVAEPAPVTVAAQPLVVGGLNNYRSLYKVRNSAVVKCTPMDNGKMKEEAMPFLINDVHGYKVVGLPGERVFQIGGSACANGRDASKQCFELVEGQKVPKTQMFTARSNFGCAVYPNFSQIFIAGGAVNE